MLARHRLSGYNLSGHVRRKAYPASSALMDSGLGGVEVIDGEVEVKLLGSLGRPPLPPVPPRPSGARSATLARVR